MLTFNRLTGIFALAAVGLLGNLDTALAQTLVATPNTVNFNVQTGGTAPSQNVNITQNGASVTIQSVSATTTTGQPWLLPSVGASSVFVSVNATGLTAGNYSGTVTVSTPVGTISFQVNLAVAATPTLNVNPAALNFANQTGTAAPLPQTISLTSSGGATNASITANTNTGGPGWLIVSPTGQVTTPTQITVNIQPAGLVAGTTYTGNIQIVSGAANGTVNIPVRLLISANPIIAANPASLTFTAQVGNSAPAQNLTLTSSGTALSYTATSSVGSPPAGSWLQVPNQTGTTNGAISVSINTSGLAVGTYIGAINITAPNAGNGNLSVPVTLNITAGPVLQLSSPTLSFAYQIGQAQPLSQTVTVGSTSGQVSFTVAAQSAQGTWLSASPTNGIAPGNFVVSVNPSGLTPGTFNGTITVTPSGVANPPQTINVTLVVSNSALLVLSPNSATFSVVAGSGGASFQNVAVTSTDGTLINFSVGVSTTGFNWLLVNTSSASTPANLTITANPAGLAVGTYTGTVTITAGAATVANSPQTIPVTLNVTSANTLGTSPGNLNFTQVPGGIAPAPQTVSVTSTGASSGAQITFATSVAFNQGQGWLAVTPSNATTPATLTMTANAAGLVAGTYTAQIILSSPGVPQLTIGVVLTVGSSGGLSGAGSMAHLAVGGFLNQNPWKTIITLVNSGTVASQAHLNFFDDNGNPLGLSLSFPQFSPVAQPPASSLDRTLSPGATLILETNGPDNQSTQTGWAQLLTSGNITGFAVFRQFVGASGQQEAVVPLESRNAGSYLLTFDNTAGFVTGVALANTSGQAAVIGVTIRDDNGVVLQSNSVALAALGHTSFDLTFRFPVTAQRRGSVEFQTPSGGGISVLGLRFNPAGAFSTIPPVAK